MQWLARRPIIGMVHLLPLPGSARGTSIGPCIDRAVQDALALAAGGADAVIIENFHDVPFPRGAAAPHTVAAMTRCVAAVRAAVPLPLGVNVLRNDVRSAIAIAHVCEAEFARCNVWVGAAVTDQGIIEGAAHEAVHYRRTLGASVAVMADVGVKHAVQLGGGDLAHQARDAVRRGLADCVIVTGPGTGVETPLERVRAVKEAVPGTPVLVGSGVTAVNACEALKWADGAIVGSSLHLGGDLAAPIDRDKVAALVDAASHARSRV